MSDSNLSKISYRKNTGAFPGLPDGTGQMTRLRFTKATLEKKNKTVQSDEITGDSQVQDLVKVGVQAGGSIDAEMIAQEFDIFFASLLRNDIVDVEVNFGTGITGQVMALSDTIDSAPRYFKISNCANDGNNGIKKVVSIDNNAHTITFAAGSFVEDSSETITLRYRYVRNGVKLPDDYLIEEQFSNPRSFAGFYGQSVDSISLNLKAQAKAELSINFMGYDGLEGDRSYGGVRQISQLIFNAKPQNGSNLTITPGRDQHYTFNTVLGTADSSVLIGTTCKATLLNLVAAINLATGAGTKYSSQTTVDNWTAAIGASTSATQTISGNANPSNNDTVTISGKTYTFKTNLTPTEGEVKIGALIGNTFDNLVAAINHGSGNGSTYSCAAANANCTAAIVSQHILLTAAAGAEGNSLSVSTTSTQLTFASETASTATASATSDGNNFSDGDTLTLNGKVYTFKTNLTPTEGEVKIALGGYAFSIQNLVLAINHGSGNGSAYSCAAQNPDASAAINGGNNHQMLLTARTTGPAGDALTLTTTATSLSLSGATFTGGAENGSFSGGTDSIVITAAQAGEDGAVSSFASSFTSGMSDDAEIQVAADPTAASSNPVMNTTANIGTVYENGALITCPLSSLGVDIKSNLRERPSIGSEGTQQLGTGDIVPTGKMDAYFKTRDLLAAFFAHADRAFEFPLIDGEGRLINFYFPRIKYTKGAPPISGKNTDIMLPIEWQAVRDPVTGYTVQIDLLDV